MRSDQPFPGRSLSHLHLQEWLSMSSGVTRIAHGEVPCHDLCFLTLALPWLTWTDAPPSGTTLGPLSLCLTASFLAHLCRADPAAGSGSSRGTLGLLASLRAPPPLLCLLAAGATHPTVRSSGFHCPPLGSSSCQSHPGRSVTWEGQVV